MGSVCRVTTARMTPKCQPQARSANRRTEVGSGRSETLARLAGSGLISRSRASDQKSRFGGEIGAFGAKRPDIGCTLRRGVCRNGLPWIFVLNAGRTLHCAPET